MARLIQIVRGGARRVALVEEPHLRLLRDYASIYALTNDAISRRVKLPQLVQDRLTPELLDYDPVYMGRSEYRVLPAIDHPDDPAHCLVSGTGLTHLGSARGRQNMHSSAVENPTDSMKMFGWGVEGGRPAAGCIGIPPEWFYKGTGTILRAHGEALEVPPYAEDGGEEAEIAGVYVIAPDGIPYRVGMAVGNEFSDHVFEKKNYLNLAGSKLRNCSLGPELVIDPAFDSVGAEVMIERADTVLWSTTFRSGAAEMCHSLQNIEHHHFKYAAHRRPGDVHVHYFGTAHLSFSDGVRLQGGDVMQIRFEGFGRPLRNPVRVAGSLASLVEAVPLG